MTVLYLIYNIECVFNEKYLQEKTWKNVIKSVILYSNIYQAKNITYK